MVSLEVFHLLHCLVRTQLTQVLVGDSLLLIYLKNILRKYTYLEYYGTVDPALADASPIVFKTHPGE